MGPPYLQHKRTRVSAYSMEDLGTAKTRVLLPAVVPPQNPGHCHTGSHPENIHQQDPGSAATQLLGEAQTPATLLTTKEEGALHNHLRVANIRRTISKRRIPTNTSPEKGKDVLCEMHPGLNTKTADDNT